MKRLTLLTAAGLLASAPLFAMDGGGVSISGESNFGVKFAESDDDSKSELQFHHEFKVTFAASGTTDGGIGFGGEMTLDNTESVTSGTVTAAKTGYIVTGDEDDGYLDARFGFNTSGLVAGDVIVSGSKANLSGYEKATDVKGHDRVITPAVPATTLVFTANDAAFIEEDNEDSLGTNEATRGSLFANLVAVEDSDAIIYEKGASLTVGNVQLNDVRKIELTTDDDNTLSDGDVITITIGSGDDRQVYTLTYDTTARAADADEKVTAALANRWDIAVQGATVVDNRHILSTAMISVTTDAGTPAVLISGDEKVKLSQAYIDSLSASVAASDKQKVNNHGEVYISMDMHKLTIGSDLDAADKLAGGLADPGFDGIGIDDVAEGVWGGSAADVRYDGDFGVASVAISYGDNAGDADWAAGFSFNVEPVTFGAGFDSNGVMSVGMGFTQGAIAMNALYSTDSDHDEADNEGFACGSDADVSDKSKATYNAAKSAACDLNNDKNIANKPDLKNQAFGVDVSYQMSEATSVVLVAAQHKKEAAHLSYKARTESKGMQGKDGYVASSDPSLTWSTSSTTVDAFGVGFSHDLGGGATLKAGAGSVDSNAVADLGITMTF